MNLKVNLDGRGFKDVASRHLDFLKSKRYEFYMLNLSTLAAILSVTLLAAAVKGHLSMQVIRSVAIWNLAGQGLNAVLSLSAK